MAGNFQSRDKSGTSAQSPNAGSIDRDKVKLSKGEVLVCYTCAILGIAASVVMLLLWIFQK